MKKYSNILQNVRMLVGFKCSISKGKSRQGLIFLESISEKRTQEKWEARKPFFGPPKILLVKRESEFGVRENVLEEGKYFPQNKEKKIKGENNNEIDRNKDPSRSLLETELNKGYHYV
jgi:hypothetical protein